MTDRRLLHLAIAVAIGLSATASSAPAASPGADPRFELDLGGLRFDPLASTPVQPSSVWGRARADGED
ncbi:hypothetical protein [Lysobacter sp. Hz 25]|uniref:hypothetical protein n=1 Tax=Lysobacter sp. Hz 25 TaxID=3383698 RepID=UPI0038D3DCE8